MASPGRARREITPRSVRAGVVLTVTTFQNIEKIIGPLVLRLLISNIGIRRAFGVFGLFGALSGVALVARVRLFAVRWSCKSTLGQVAEGARPRRWRVWVAGRYHRRYVYGGLASNHSVRIDYVNSYPTATSSPDPGGQTWSKNAIDLPQSMIHLERDTAFTRWGLPTIGIGSVLTLWILSTTVFGIFQTLVLPSPFEIISSFISAQELIVENLIETLKVVVIGYIAAVSGGIIIGSLLVINERFREMFLPTIVGMNSVPRIAFAPVLLFYFGEFQAKYLIAASIAFFPMLINVMEGMGTIDEEIDQFLDSLDASRWQKYKAVRFPNALPFIFNGMKIAVTLTVVGAVVGEFVGSDVGIGYLALLSVYNFNTPMLFAVVGVIAIISLIIFLSVHVLQRRVVFWKEADLVEE